MTLDKTELFLLKASSRLTPLVSSVTVCGEIIELSSSSRKIGVEFVSFMSMEKHVILI